MADVTDRLVIRGAREHNLRNISLELPRDALIVFTGLSGSGKSSLAFDTIFAEGQRRYVESLSAYARQFLGQMDKPDVDFIEGLSPAVSIDQKSTSRNPRSTVGTITEVYDYLRLLYARAGRPHCPICGEPISRQSPQQIVDRLLALEPGTRFQILAPVVRGRKGEYVDVFRQLAGGGFSRARVDGEIISLTEPADPGQEVQALDRRRGGPAGRQADCEAAPDRLGRDGPGTRAGCDHHRLRRPRRKGPAARAELLRKAGLSQRSRHRHRGARAAAVLVQRAVGCLPGVLGAGHADGGRPGARGARRREDPGPGGYRAVGLGPGGRLLLPADRLARGELRLPYGRALALTTGRGEEAVAVRGAGAGACPLPEPVRTGAQLQREVRGGRLLHRAPARRGRDRHLPGTLRRLHARGAVHRVSRRPPQADLAGGDDRRQEHRRGLEPVDRRCRRVPGPPRAHRSRAADRRAGAQGDQRATEVPPRRRPRLPVPQPADGEPVRR